MIKKLFFTGMLSLLSLYVIGCRTPELPSDWTAVAITIDGKEGDWQSISSHNFEELLASLAVCNDAENLYLLLRAENPMTSRHLRGRGITLSFSAERGDEPPLRLSYSGGNTFLSGDDPHDSFWEALSSQQKKRYRDRQREIRQSITITRDGTSSQMPPDGSRGPEAAVLLSRDAVGYEFKIPLQPGDDRTYALHARPGETLNIGIKIGHGESEERRPENLRGEPAAMMAGGGMGRMGGRGGGDMGVMPGVKLPEKREVRFKVTLAKTLHSSGESHTSTTSRQLDTSHRSGESHSSGASYNRLFQE